ncbi:MAG: YkgJ family cysteine cluster protein [Methanosarcinaceae archaeon]|nr:YkgJ family cysteine cluster protein [Methanosarcinaceae archaeon]MDD4332049.1 YkgJ family cysteine cluster protein [Methanosarcinaceae archaeon]MDD4749549.1 YkgJ family cysteine cluster protein [Methanosarcinaceae archaeon]
MKSSISDQKQIFKQASDPVKPHWIQGLREEKVEEEKQKTQKSKYQLLLLANLKKEIEKAKTLSPKKIAADIRKIGFSCQFCGKCCKRAYGDNRVLLLPEEIKKIREYTGILDSEIASPLLPDCFSDCDSYAFKSAGVIKKLFSKDSELTEEEIDSEGNIHTFGWMLRRKNNGDCGFIDGETNKCRIYPVRSRLCSTYPFYLEAAKLQTCECEGLGFPISEEESLKMAKAVLSRYLVELEDMLALYEKFENFETGEKGPEIARKNAEAGFLSCIVHDSNGTFRIKYN